MSSWMTTARTLDGHEVVTYYWRGGYTPTGHSVTNDKAFDVNRFYPKTTPLS